MSTFTLPTGSGLAYPATRLTKQIKITGSFVTAYSDSTSEGYKVIKTDFSALTQAVDEYTQTTAISGNIALLTDVMFIDRIEGAVIGTPIDAWEPNSYHAFRGVVIG